MAGTAIAMGVDVGERLSFGRPACRCAELRSWRDRGKVTPTVYHPAVSITTPLSTLTPRSRTLSLPGKSRKHGVAIGGLRGFFAQQYAIARFVYQHTCGGRQRLSTTGEGASDDTSESAPSLSSTARGLY